MNHEKSNRLDDDLGTVAESLREMLGGMPAGLTERLITHLTDGPDGTEAS